MAEIGGIGGGGGSQLFTQVGGVQPHAGNTQQVEDNEAAETNGAGTTNETEENENVNNSGFVAASSETDNGAGAEGNDSGFASSGGVGSILDIFA